MTHSTSLYTAAFEKMTVNQVITAIPATVAVFQRFGIDACCGGAKPLAEVAARHGIDMDELAAALLEQLYPNHRDLPGRSPEGGTSSL